MKVAITYTEEWRRTVDHEINDAEFAEWFGDGDPTACDIQEYLEATEEREWQPHTSAPGHERLDEFIDLDIEEVEIPTTAELADDYDPTDAEQGPLERGWAESRAYSRKAARR